MFPCASFMPNLLSHFMLGPSGLPMADLNLWPAEASQKTEHTIKTALLRKKNRKRYFSLFPDWVAVQNISIWRGSRIPLYKSNGSCCSSENIYTLLIWFITLEISFDERSKKADGFEKDPNSYSPLRKSGMKIFIVQFFYKLKVPFNMS